MQGNILNHNYLTSQIWGKAYMRLKRWNSGLKDAFKPDEAYINLDRVQTKIRLKIHIFKKSVI